MAIPFAALASGLSSLGSGGSNTTDNNNPYNGGLLTRIGGTGADPLNAINVLAQMNNAKYAKEQAQKVFDESVRQYNEQLKLEKEKEKQRALEAQYQAGIAQRQQNMGAMNLLGTQRQAAQGRARDIGFQNDLLGILR